MTKSNDGFEKIGNDLVYNLRIDLYDFIINDSVTVPHPDNQLNIKIPKGIETDKPLRLKGKGYSRGNLIGDYYIKLNVVNNVFTEEMKNNIINFLK